MPVPPFFKFRFMVEKLCIGERIKKGSFRPCLTTIPMSTIIGSLKDNLSIDGDVKAVGYLTKEYLEKIESKSLRKTEVFAPTDNCLGSAKLPLTVEYLIDAEGVFFVHKNDAISSPDIILNCAGAGNFKIGALKSKGFGHCTGMEYLGLANEEELSQEKGILRTRIYEDEESLRLFGIEEIIMPRFGYLFKPQSLVSGYYQRALIEGSIIRGYKFLLEE